MHIRYDLLLLFSFSLAVASIKQLAVDVQFVCYATEVVSWKLILCYF